MGTFSRRDFSNSKDISSVGTLVITETPSSSKFASTTAGTFSRRDFRNSRNISSVRTLEIAYPAAVASTPAQQQAPSAGGTSIIAGTPSTSEN